MQERIRGIGLNKLKGIIGKLAQEYAFRRLAGPITPSPPAKLLAHS
jgi:hypothetical protein